MALEFLDKLFPYIPSIKKPEKPLSIKEKMYWTVGVLAVYFVLYNTYAYGVNQQAINQTYQLISIIFAAKIGSIITVGIGPIVATSILLQLFVGSGLLNLDLQNPQHKARFQALQKIITVVLALVEALIIVLTGYVPVSSASFVLLVILQMFAGAVMIMFLDEIMSNYGITSGINLFIASGVSFAIVAGIVFIIFPEAIAAAAAGGSAAIPNAVMAFGPLMFTVLILGVSIYAYEMKVELPLSFSQFGGIGGKLPITFLYVSVIPVIFATYLELSLSVWFRFLAGVSGGLQNLARFIAYYQPINGVQQLQGGLLYLITPSFPLPYSAQYGGIGGYGAYATYLLSHTTNLFIPWGGMVLVPEWVHIIVYAVVLILLSVLFGKLWVEMSGMSAKDMAGQIGDMGWQIPGFRRDPRIVESVLNKYIPTITILGSMFVGALAAVANLSGAVGTGIGILLSVGIIYALYQQLEQERFYESYPALDKFLNK